MKKTILFLLLIITSVLSFGQTEVDIWKKTGSIKKVFTTRKFTFPKNFTSRAPSGKQIVYQKVDHPGIKMETSSGKKWTKSPIIYKSTNDFGVITYDGKSWSGLHTEDGYNVSNLTKEVVTNVKMDSEKFHYGEQVDVLVSPSKSNKKIGRIVQNNPDFYNPLIRINKTCGVYVEVTNDLFKFWGSDTGRVSQYVTTILTNVIALYDREGVNVTLNKVFIWDTPDPYGNPFDNSQYLNTFTENINKLLPTDPEAHFKHLLHNKNFGGIAWINGESDGYLTQPNLDPYYTCAVTGIGSNNVVNSNVTYSWPVMCFTHEMGHNLGSKHTHWCGWKNSIGTNIGRLDSCYRGESSDGPENCTSSTYTITKSNTRGSIMSYCHLNGQISFTTGFGQYPRYTIRSNLNGSTEIPFDGGNVPTVTTDTDTLGKIGAQWAFLSGQVVTEGGFPVLERGFIWSLQPSPTYNLSTKIAVGLGTGNFNTRIILANNNFYYVRTYARNAVGISYGNEILIKTPPFSPPLLTTVVASSITNNTAISGAIYISIGNSSILERGIVLSTTNPLPTTSDIKVVTPAPTNANFTTSITGLIPNTTYYYRSFARNVSGTGYGDVFQLTTIPTGEPSFVITVPPANYVTSNSIIGTATINSTGGTTITDRGFYISTIPNDLTVAKRPIVTATQTGAFQLLMSGLIPRTLYYLRFYVTNGDGTFTSPDLAITTPFVIGLDEVGGIESTKATVKYTIAGPSTSMNLRSGIDYTSSGILISTNVSPTRANSQFFIETPYVDAGQNTVISQNLLPNTTYYVRALIPGRDVDYFSHNILQFTTTTTPGIPSVQTLGIATKTKNSISINGQVSSSGTSSVYSRGFCYSTSPNPTINNSTIVSGVGLGAYTGTITNLTQSTIYYVKAFATNKSGTSYGDELNVMTIGDVPTVITSPIINITPTFANSGGNVTNTGGSSVNAKGVVWSTSPNPTINLSTVSNDGNGLGSYTSALRSLSQNTKYYVRAYAINDDGGVSYGQELSFTTLATFSTPTVVTNKVSYVDQTTARLSGVVSADGGYPVTAKGVCWSTSPNPQITLTTKTFNGTGVGEFESTITGLTLGVKYYVRAYATNQIGTNYGAEFTFTTFTGLPTITTTTPSGLTPSSAITGGNVVSLGNTTVSQRGVCWSKFPNPTEINNPTSDGSGLGSFTSVIKGLDESTTYYVRAYAKSELGTAYGEQKSFTTLPLSSGSCLVTGLSAYKNESNSWILKYNINPRCVNYSVNVCRYNYPNLIEQPGVSVVPVSCGIRNGMTSYVPSTQENLQKYIEKEMNPQPTAATKPGFGGWWYSIDVKCSSSACVGSNLTKYYFYVPGF